MNREYDSNGFKIMWLQDYMGDIITLLGIDGDIIKEYTIESDASAEAVFYHISEMMDNFPEDLAKFKIKRDCPIHFTRSELSISVE